MARRAGSLVAKELDHYMAWTGSLVAKELGRYMACETGNQSLKS